MLAIWVRHSTTPSSRALLHIPQGPALLELLLRWLVEDGVVGGVVDRNHCRYWFNSWRTDPVPESRPCVLRKELVDRWCEFPAAAKCLAAVKAAASL
jgi:hypothetical protein